MLNHKHLLKTAAMACLLLGTGPLLAAGANSNYSASDAKILANIPAAAQAVIVIHDMAALDKKVAMLAQKLKIPVLPPSLRHIERSLNLPRGITAHGTAAVVIIPNHATGGTAHAVMILPAKDPATALANMNFSTGTDGVAHGQTANGQNIYAMAGKHCLMVSQHERALLRCKTVSSPITPLLTPSQQPLVESSDVYVLLNVPQLRKPMEKAMKNANSVKADQTTANGKAVPSSTLKIIGRKVIMGLADDTHTALIGLRITTGALTISMVSDEKAGSQVAKALECLRPLAARPLIGLPNSTQLFEAAASNIDGVMTAKLLNQWAKQVPTSASSGARSSQRISGIIKKLAALIRPFSQSNVLINTAAGATGSLIASVELAKSATPAASAASMVQLLASEGRWLTNFELSMGTKMKYHMTVAQKKVTIASIPFTVVKQSMVMPTAGTAQSDAVRSALKMQQKIMGVKTQTYLIGSNNKQVILGANGSDKILAETVKAAAANADPLGSNSTLAAAQSHILAGSSVVVYMDLSPIVAAITQRLEAMANMNSPLMKLPATEPMSISLSAQHNILTGQWRMPMKNLEQLSTRIHALIPLAMMMEMQSMQAGQGGAGAPQ